MSPDPARRRQAASPGVILGALILLATALRFWRLGEWGFDGDEIFTLRDSVNPSLQNPRPLLYFLNHYVVGSVLPLDEFGLRLLPALFGVLAVPALFLVVRRLVNTRAAVFSALLVTLSPLHVYQSQYARYWSLVFLLSSIYPYAMYLGFRERNRGIFAFGIITGILAVLAHPASVLLLGGLILWLWITHPPRDFWNQKSARVGAVVVVLLLGVIALRYLPVLRAWILLRPRRQFSEHLLHLPKGAGIQQIGLVLSYVDGLTIPLVLTGALGIYLLWQGRDRWLALLLMCLFIFPVAFILLLSFRTAVGTTYILPTAPIFFIGAGVFLDRLAAVEWGIRPRWLPTATVATMMIAGGLPTLISQYRDGRRNNFQAVARWLDKNLAPGDVVYSDQYRILTRYLQRAKVEQLSADTVPLIQSVRSVHQTSRDAALWIVLPYSSRGGHRTNPRIGILKRWIYDNCQLRMTIGVARLDFRQNELQIYRCPPVTTFGVANPPSRAVLPEHETDSALSSEF